MDKKALLVTRDVTPDECHWLERIIWKGETVFAFHGCTYGCVSGNGVAVTEKLDEAPFFELPRNAVAPVPPAASEGE